MSDPLVSILMPTYRRPHYLRQALASAVGQTYKNLQVVVRDNASGDETPEVVRSFNDPRIEFLQASQTGSAWENGSACLAHAKGKYVMTLCDDDVLGNNYVAILTAFLEQDADIRAAYGATHVIDETGTVTKRYVPNGTYTAQAREFIQAWCGGTLPLASGINCLCPTSFILSLGDSHSFPEGHNSDNAVFMAAAIQGKVLFTDACLFYYRIHGQNSAKGHGCELRARGDLAFLAFLDAQVSSASDVGLSKVDWPGLREQLEIMLAGGYYQHLIQIRLHQDTLWQLLCDTAVYPARTYSSRTVRLFLRMHRYPLKRELWNRVPSGLRRFLKPLVRHL